MRRPDRIFAAIAGLLATPTVAAADDEAPNRAYVATDRWGQCYARSVPAAPYGVEGETIVYRVGAAGDSEVARYDWYAPQLFISCNVSDGAGTIAPALVQIGPWPRGRKPDAATVAVAFHYNGALVARYSTLDLAGGDPKNASCSVSHYAVIESISGFSPDARSFSLTTVDGRMLALDTVSGELVETVKGAAAPRGQCYEENWREEDTQ